MLDLDRLRHVTLSPKPFGQEVMARFFLRPDYRWPRRTEIVLEGIDEHLERGRGYIFAMNHTDRFNYWPCQYALRARGWGYTATWVKGKYYENPVIAAFMDAMNNIPMPSRGYVIAAEFKQRTHRVPTAAEYRQLRDLVDGELTAETVLDHAVSNDVRSFLQTPDPAAYLTRFEATFAAMIREVVRLSRRAFDELHQHLLIFPEGTRSRRLAKGRTGIAQISQHLGAPIVPVGCNGSDTLYPGDSPFSKGGRVVYRVGRPIEATGPELSAVQVPNSELPFTRAATQRYGERYQVITDIVMDHINALVDERYQRDDALKDGDGAVVGVDRFL